MLSAFTIFVLAVIVLVNVKKTGLDIFRPLSGMIQIQTLSKLAVYICILFWRDRHSF